MTAASELDPAEPLPAWAFISGEDEAEVSLETLFAMFPETFGPDARKSIKVASGFEVALQATVAFVRLPDDRLFVLVSDAM